MRQMKLFGLCIILLAGVVLPPTAWSTVLFQSGFEYAANTTPDFPPTGAADGWFYNGGSCNDVRPCVYGDVSTDVAHSGTKSWKADFPAGTSQPNNCCLVGLSHWLTASGLGYFRTPIIYVRYYTYLVNFVPAIPTTKNVYFRDENGTPNTFTAVLVFFDGQRELGIATQVEDDPTHCQPPAGGTFGNCNDYPNIAHVFLNNNQWYCVESYIDMGTPGAANGSLGVWIDGTQTALYTGRMFRNATRTDATVAWDQIRLMRQDGQGIQYWDDVVVSTSRIGCLSAPSDTTPPTVPQNVTVQ